MRVEARKEKSTIIEEERRIKIRSDKAMREEAVGREQKTEM